MLFKPKHLNLWRNPSSMGGVYVGAHWDGWYWVYDTNRDASLIRESNWDYLVKFLGGENPSAADEQTGLLIVEENHAACGWIKWMGIHQSDVELLKKADERIGWLEDYLIFDENDLGEREMDYQYELVKQEVHHFVWSMDADIDPPTDEEEEMIVYLVCQALQEYDQTPGRALMQKMYDKTIGHVCRCPREEFGGTYLDSERCPCGRGPHPKRIHHMTREEWDALSDDEKATYYIGTPYTPAHTNYHYLMCLDAWHAGEEIPGKVKQCYRWQDAHGRTYEPFKSEEFGIHKQ